MTDPRGRPSRPVAMLTHSYYEEDPRVRREAEAVLAAGHPVEVFALRRPGEPDEAIVDGVHVHHLDVQRHQGAGLGTYLREYAAFFARAALALLRAGARRRFALVQVHTLPDFLIVAALPLRLAGVPLLLDLHEAMPEFFRSRFPRVSNPLIRQLLLLQERLSIAVASHVLTVNQALADRLVSLGVERDRITVVRNSPSLARFDAGAYPRRQLAEDGTLRLIYAGALTPTYELDIVLRALARIRQLRPALPVTFEVYGRGDSEAALRALATELGLAGLVRFHGRIPLEEVPRAVAAADIGLAPTRRDPFTAISLSTKIFEYAAMGKPAVCSRLPLVEATFPPGSVWTYTPGSIEELAETMLGIVDDPTRRTAAVANAAAAVERLAWEREAAVYRALVERLIGSR